MSELLEKCKRCVDQAYIDWGKTRLSNREKREVEEYEVWGMVQLALHILNFDEYNKLKSYIWETHGYDPGGTVKTGQMTFFDLYGDKSEQPAVIRCKDCKYYSATTVGMPHACWKDSYMIFGETGEHAEHHVCRRIDSPEHYCSYAVRKQKGGINDS